ncbi:peptide-methionine (S)-S-oxide reductase MsrA [Candidatus Woesearchaeota archaeon]|nr:peptide-methionine (S)-S-oxide reductase MsrA [Candidatus Woesearchaeota archaeon]
MKKATFAGGCFWCSEADFKDKKGVIDVFSGFTGGKKKNPTYDEVCSETTGHVEAIEVTYDPLLVSYDELLEIYWRHIDPTDPDGQFADRGLQYRAVIFYHDDEQKRKAKASKEKLDKSGRFEKPIVTMIKPASQFYRAEDYHRDYYRKNPLRYKMYRLGSGREKFIKEMW